jgi:hypothetical protein
MKYAIRLWRKKNKEWRGKGHGGSEADAEDWGLGIVEKRKR